MALSTPPPPSSVRFAAFNDGVELERGDVGHADSQSGGADLGGD
jgi:hypothetical protein